MKNFIKSAAIAATVVLGATAANAASDLNPWQQCGLGAMVFPENGTAAAISNIIWDLGTTAVTSAAASEDQCKGAGASVGMFVQATYPSLTRDTAIGEGEYIATLLDAAECDAEVRPQLVASLREDLVARTGEAAYAEMSDTARAEQYFLDLRETIRADYAGQCNPL